MFHFVVKIFLSVGMVANTCMTLANKYLFWSIHPHGTVLMDVSLIDGTFKLSPSHIKKDRSKNTQYFWDLHGIIKVILLNNLRLSTMDFAGHLKVQLYNGTKAVCLCGPQLIVHSICAGIHGNIVSTGQPCYAYCWSIGNARFWSANHVESFCRNAGFHMPMPQWDCSLSQMHPPIAWTLGKVKKSLDLSCLVFLTNTMMAYHRFCDMLQCSELWWGEPPHGYAELLLCFISTSTQTFMFQVLSC